MDMEDFSGLKYKKEEEKTAMVSGASLTIIFEDKALSANFYELIRTCQCVIVYRCSPSEKAQIVNFVVQQDPEAFTCAIGDGANDINMIQTAHVGVGIEGNEGNLAAYFGDYSLPEFQGLRRLLLWHGRAVGHRSYSWFVPNLIFAGHLLSWTMFWSNWMNGMSGINIFVAYYYAMHNVLNTIFLPTFTRVFDNDAEYHEASGTSTVKHSSEEVRRMAAQQVCDGAQ